RASSCRECSRRASSLSARARNSAARSPGVPGSTRTLLGEGLAPDAVGRGVLLLLSHGRHVFAHTGVGPNLGFDLARQSGVLFQESASVILPLADPIAAVAVPRAGFFDHLVDYAEIDHLTLARDALAVEDVEIGCPERRRDFVLYHLDAGLGTDHFVAL